MTSLFLITLVAGCPGTMDGNGNGDGDGNGSPDTVSATIVSPITNFSISALEEPVSILYTVTGEPDEIFGFVIPVADSTPGSGPIGDPVVVATDLAPGTNRAFDFDPGALGVGNYRVGITARTGDMEFSDESDAVIQVEGVPMPRFIRPADAFTVAEVGELVTISFDAGDPEGLVQWRLFLLAETDSRTVSPDQLGMELRVGSGNVGSFQLDTATIAPGDYEVGLSATDSGFSILSTVGRGEIDKIVTIPSDTASGPIIRVIAPAE